MDNLTTQPRADNCAFPEKQRNSVYIYEAENGYFIEQNFQKKFVANNVAEALEHVAKILNSNE